MREWMRDLRHIGTHKPLSAITFYQMFSFVIVKEQFIPYMKKYHCEVWNPINGITNKKMTYNFIFKPNYSGKKHLQWCTQIFLATCHALILYLTMASQKRKRRQVK